MKSTVWWSFGNIRAWKNHVKCPHCPQIDQAWTCCWEIAKLFRTRLAADLIPSNWLFRWHHGSLKQHFVFPFNIYVKVDKIAMKNTQYNIILIKNGFKIFSYSNLTLFSRHTITAYHTPLKNYTLQPHHHLCFAYVKHRSRWCSFRTCRIDGRLSNYKYVGTY